MKVGSSGRQGAWVFLAPRQRPDGPTKTKETTPPIKEALPHSMHLVSPMVSLQSAVASMHPTLVRLGNFYCDLMPVPRRGCGGTTVPHCMFVQVYKWRLNIKGGADHFNHPAPFPTTQNSQQR